MINKILIIGFGSIGKKYFKIIKKKFQKIKIGIYSKQNISGRYKLRNYSDIITYNPDLTIFCNPSSKRLEILKIIKKTKSHILFEKPLVDDFKKINRIRVPNKKIYKVGYNLRQLKILIKLKDLINSKKIGKIYSYHIEAGEFLPNWRKLDYTKTVSAKKNLGGGVILELSHEIDYALWLFGMAENVHGIFAKLSNLKINVEDIAKIILLNNNKIIGSINLDFLTHKKKRFCHVVGAKGELVLDFIKKNIKFYDNYKKKWEIIFKSNQNINETYFLQLSQMIQLIKNKKSKNRLGTIKDSKNILKIINKIKTNNK